MFFVIRHFVDSYNLLVVFKTEIESGGHLVRFLKNKSDKFRSNQF
jgi:hypothetical protein